MGDISKDYGIVLSPHRRANMVTQLKHISPATGSKVSKEAK